MNVATPSIHAARTNVLYSSKDRESRPLIVGQFLPVRSTFNRDLRTRSLLQEPWLAERDEMACAKFASLQMLRRESTDDHATGKR
jgi:hypothetical protein